MKGAFDSSIDGIRSERRQSRRGGTSVPQIKTFGDVDRRSLEQLERCMEAGDAELGVLCADHPPGYSQPIGGAIAYEGYVSPSGVGYDIACGNKAVETDITRAQLDADLGGAQRVMRAIAAPIEPQRKLRETAAEQLGTVGSGNHFVNLFEDERGTIWVGVHFGSRGFGFKTASGFLALAQGLPFDERERKRLGLKVSEGEMD